jgi:hypothetical protein
MKTRIATVALLAVIALSLIVAPFSPVAAARGYTFPVTGTGSLDDGTLVNFAGNYTIQKFRVLNNQVAAVGTLSGAVTDAVTGATLGTVTNRATTVNLISAEATADCQILHLELGPLDLDLLGLVVHLDQIVLDITAVPGAGNLLGNLLCAIAGLLDGNAPLNIIADLLNSVLDILNWLG